MNIQAKDTLASFFNEVLPENIPPNAEFKHIKTREVFVKDVIAGIEAAPMSIRLTPHIMSLIDVCNFPQQFIPLFGVSQEF